MSVRIQLPEVLARGLAPTPKAMHCPYAGCTGHVEAKLHGEIVGIWAGHGPEPLSIQSP